MEELIQRAAEHLGYPPGMVERSARARAQAEGTSVEAVLAGWLGEAAPAGAEGAAPATAPAAAPPAASPAAEAPAAEAPAAEAAPTGPAVEVLAPAAPPPPPAAQEPEPEEDEEEDEARSRFAVPAWLAAAFVAIPLIAVVYALFLPNGPGCGSGAVLALDPETGEAVNCDGSDYGTEALDFVSMGAEMYSTCGACHGPTGGGIGDFPAFTGGALLTTFPAGQCETHVEWVKLGTQGWPDPTYGDNQQPVGGSGALMPGFEGTPGWDELAIRAVVLYERVAFGLQDLAEAEVDCGLVTAEGDMVDLAALP